MDEHLGLLIENLYKAERRNRRLNALLFLLSALIGVLALLKSRDSRKAAEFSTSHLVLTDGTGKTRAEMVAASDGPSLKLYDTSGKTRLAVALVNDIPTVTLGNADGIGVAAFGAPATGPGLMLYDQAGFPRAQFDVGESGPRLYLEDRKGFSATLGNFYFVDDAAKNKKTIAASLVLAHRTLGTIWQAPSPSIVNRLP